jgi:tRNA(fMet)-specific endonuclease VapC
MGLMLDTNVFIHYERAQQAIDFSPWEAYGSVYISSVTASELLVGVHYAKNDVTKMRRTAFVETILSHIPILAFAQEEARIHAGLFAQLAQQGQMIGAHDLMIAATAIAHDCALLTNNVGEFERVSGLEVVSFEKS